MSEIVDLAEALEDLFPIGSDILQLEVVPTQNADWRKSSEPAAYATFRTIVWDVQPDTGERMIRSVAEQDVYMGWPTLYEDRERVAAFVQALGQVMTEIPAHAAEELMPHDLIHPDVLQLRKASSVEDFNTALRTNKRLGRLLTS